VHVSSTAELCDRHLKIDSQKLGVVAVVILLLDPMRCDAVDPCIICVVDPMRCDAVDPVAFASSTPCVAMSALISMGEFANYWSGELRRWGYNRSNNPCVRSAA
jgi:hypothetical protein